MTSTGNSSFGEDPDDCAICNVKNCVPDHVVLIQQPDTLGVKLVFTCRLYRSYLCLVIGMLYLLALLSK